MSIVNGSLQVARLTTAQIAASSTVPLSGQLVFNTQTGQFKFGDGATTLSALTYNVVGVTGSGSYVFATSPTFVTNITTPLIIGGSAVGSVIQYKGTSGNGTSTVAAHQFLVGNNGGTTAVRIYNDGNVNIGNSTSTSQRIFRVGQDTAFVDIGSYTGATSVVAMYFNTATPGSTTFGIAGTSAFMQINAPTTNVILSVANSSKATFASANVTFADPYDFVLGSTTGTKIGTGTTQKLAFWNATPIVQPTTAVAAATFVANTSGIANDSATFDGYTIGQVVKALRNTGLLA